MNIRDHVWDQLLDADMHARYWAERASCARLATTILNVLGLFFSCGTVALLLAERRDAAPTIVGVIAALVAAFSGAWNGTQAVSELTGLHASWAGLMYRWERTWRALERGDDVETLTEQLEQEQTALLRMGAPYHGLLYASRIKKIQKVVVGSRRIPAGT